MRLATAAALLLVFFGAEAHEVPPVRIHSAALLEYCGVDAAIHVIMIEKDRVNVHLFIKVETPAKDYNLMLEMIKKWKAKGGNVKTVDLNKFCIRT